MAVQKSYEFLTVRNIGNLVLTPKVKTLKYLTFCKCYLYTFRTAGAWALLITHSYPGNLEIPGNA